ncbi:unnamed protein product [Amaranthus hypochondriacus]
MSDELQEHVDSVHVHKATGIYNTCFSNLCSFLK